MAGIRAGTLRKRVTIQQPSAVGGVQKWTTFGTAWAEVEPVLGTESAGQLEPTNVVMSNVTMRYRPGIVPKMRLLLGTRILEISSVINFEEHNHELNLACREVMN